MSPLRNIKINRDFYCPMSDNFKPFIFSRYLLLGIIFLYYSQNLYGFEITIKKGDQSEKISSRTIRGNEYISTKKLAEILDANYYYSPQKRKSEL